MVKNNLYIFRIGYIPRPSSGNLLIPSHHMDNGLNLEPPKICLCQLTKNLADEIAPHISSALGDLRLIFEESILSSSPKMADTDPAGN